MGDFPGLTITPLFVHTFSRYSAGLEAGQNLAGGYSAQSITWPVANTAVYVPMWIPWPYSAKRVWWYNGASITSVNMDFGIYTADGTRIYSTGSTAAAGSVSAAQYTTPSTDLLLSPGMYYFALVSSSITTDRGGFGSTTASVIQQRLAGLLQETSALPLPATMTGVAVANSIMPMCGVTRTTSGF